MAIMLTVMMIKENPFLLIMATLARLLINHRIWTDAATVGGRGGRRGALLILSVLPLSTLYLCSLMYLDVPFCTLVYFGTCTLVLLQYHLPKAHSHLQKDGEGLSFRGATTSIPIDPHSKISCTTSIPNACPMYTHPMYAHCIPPGNECPCHIWHTIRLKATRSSCLPSKPLVSQWGMKHFYCASNESNVLYPFYLTFTTGSLSVNEPQVSQ